MLMKTKIMYILLGLLAILIHYFAYTHFFHWFYIQSDLIQTLFYSCLIAPFTEEILFRAGPLQLIKSINFRSESSKAKMIFLTVIFSSIVFGWMHGYGWESVLKQGVMGLVFSIVYIRTGYSYLSAVTLHSLWNITCLFL